MENKLSRNRIFIDIEVISVILFILFSMLVAWIFYRNLTDFHADNLKKYLVTIARTATIKIDGDNLNEIHTPSDINKPVFIDLVDYLEAIRLRNPDIRYVYIMRKTDDENILEFIVDADALDSRKELDINRDGMLEASEKTSLPGDKYNISNMPFMKMAFNEPTTDNKITVDQWGKLISGYAPIFNSQGDVVAILGVDIGADDYYRLQERSFFGFFILIAVLILSLFIVFFLIRQRRKELRILQEIDQEKSDFIALASHQLRTPLSASKWCMHMLKEGDYGEINVAFQNTLQKLCVTNQRMINLVNDLLKIFKLDANGIKAHFRAVDLKNLCVEIYSEIEHRLKEKNINYNLNIEPELFEVFTDPNLLKEIISDLLDNAIKYSPKNTDIELRINIENNKIKFSVIDHGYGIPETERNKIFTKLYRASNIIKKELSGTGLGLYFVKKVVELLGGEINFITQENSGSTFYFSLPQKIEN
ncbi:MAG: ATP-binding protein [Patescibacteria group bacterium]